MRLRLLILIFLVSGVLFSQKMETKVDSLLFLTKQDISKDSLASLYNNISNETRGYDYEMSKDYALKAIRLSKQIDNQVNLCHAYHNLGSHYYYISEFDSSIYYNKLALKIALDNELKMLIGRSYNNLAVDYDQIGELDKAIEYSMKCLQVNEELGDIDGMASANLELGSVYYQQGVFEEAMNHFKAALELDIQVDYKSGIAYDYGNIGTVFQKMDQIDSAIYYLRKSATIREELREYHSLTITYTNLGNIYRYSGRVDSARVFFDKALELTKITEDRDAMSHLYVSLAILELKHFKNFRKAETYGLKSRDLAIEIKSLYREIKSIEILSEIYEFKGDYKEAVKYHKLYALRQDSLVNSKNAQILSDLKTKHQKEKHRIEISNLEQQKEASEMLHESELREEQLRSSNKQKVIYFLVVGLLVVAVLGFIAYRNFNEKKKANEEIRVQKEIVEEKNKEILDSINYAKRIQSAILPTDQSIKTNFPNSFVLYKPKDIVAGDFYWLETSKSSEQEQEQEQEQEGKGPVAQDSRLNTVLIAAADCTGHGVPGAMVSVVCNNGLNRSVREFGLTDPGQILDKTRELVIQEFEKSEDITALDNKSEDTIKDGMDIALISIEQEQEQEQVQEGSGSVAVARPSKLSYAGAHNPLWIIRKGEDRIEEIKADKQPIGKFSHPKPFTTHSVELHSGDTVYIFSDGYADQFGGDKGKKMKASNFKKLLLSNSKKTMVDQKKILDQAFEEWRGDLEQLDDVCIIGIRV